MGIAYANEAFVAKKKFLILQLQLTEVIPVVQPLAPDCNKSNRFLIFIILKILKMNCSP